MTSIELLDLYMNQQLPEPQTQELEQKLRTDAELQHLLENVETARAAIRFRATNLKIKALHTQYVAEIRAEQSSVPVIPLRRNSFSTWAVRIAASVLLCVAGYGTYQYSALDTQRLYSDKFIPYQLPVTRGDAAGHTRLESQYRSGNYKAVARQFADLTAKKPSDYFLAGMAYLQQNEYQPAIAAFTALRQYNLPRLNKYFDQETDYYLALAYLGANDVDKAYTLFTHIHNTPRHLYQATVTDGDLLKLKLLHSKQ